MKKILVILIICSNWMNAQETFSLQAAIDYALKNRSEIRLSQLEVESADARISEIKSTGMPKVDGSINYQYFFAVPATPIPDFITPAVYGVLEAEGVPGISPYVGPPEIQKLSFFQKTISLLTLMQACFCLVALT